MNFRVYHLLFVLILGVVLACGDDGIIEPELPEPTKTLIAVESGEEQSGIIGEFLTDPILIQLMDSIGTSIPFASLEITGDGDFETTQFGDDIKTDSLGLVAVTWKLGNRYFNVMRVKFPGNDSLESAEIHIEIKGLYEASICPQ